MFVCMIKNITKDLNIIRKGTKNPKTMVNIFPIVVVYLYIPSVIENNMSYLSK